MILTIKNEFLEVKINDFGAELWSIKKVHENEEYLWQGDVKYWGRRAPILFPIVGKLLNDTYCYKDHTYHMKQHGFARDRNFQVVSHHANRVSLMLTEDELSLCQYPFRFTLVLSYELVGNEIVVGYDVTNNHDDVMPFSIGAHPAFNWNKSENAYFCFDTHSLSTYELTSEGVSYEKSPVIMNQQKVLVDETLFYKDALILEDIEKCTFLNGNHKIEMDFRGFPFLGLWSKPTGAPFVCIEPWHGIADFVDAEGDIFTKKGMIHLESQNSFKSSYHIKIL